jgi:hypothetical protein
VYANKADHMLILPIYLSQVLTNEKSEKSEKAILTPSIGPQRNLLNKFFVLTQSQKSLLAHSSKDKMVRIWPTLNFFSSLKSLKSNFDNKKCLGPISTFLKL